MRPILPLPVDVPSTSLSLKHHNPQVFGSSRLLSQKTYVVARTCLAFNSLYWLIRSVRVFGNAHWLVSAFDPAWYSHTDRTTAAVQHLVVVGTVVY